MEVLHLKKDGHIHTKFCPHGSKDPFEKYIERALTLGLEEISFTEHAPLPEGFIDTTPTKDSAMKWDDLEEYFQEISRVKQLYKGKIMINCGLEVDYIEGYEEEIKKSLDKIGPSLDDAILSVHFLKNDSLYDCVDYSPQLFAEMVQSYGSIEKIYIKYYETLRLSVRANLGKYKPKRIGHMTLVHKFQNKFPYEGDERAIILSLLQEIKEHGYSLDYNGAGTAKPLCREAYPPNWVVEEAIKLNIPLVYGSDAHQAKEMGQGMEQILFL